MKLEEVDICGKKIITHRLVLRLFEDKDLNDFYEYAKVDGVGEAAGWTHHANIEESKAILQHFITEHRTFALTEKASGKVIGSLGIEKSEDVFCKDYGDKNINELGYVLSKDYWGAGLMTEAVKAVIKFVFDEWNLDAVTCSHFIENDRSRRVIEKCGFRYYGDTVFVGRNGQKHKSKCYIITREEYLNAIADKSKGDK